VVDIQGSGSVGSWFITTTILSFATTAAAGATVGLTAGTAVGAAAAFGASLAGSAAAGAAAAGAAAAGAEAGASSPPPQATMKAESSINDSDIKAIRLMPILDICFTGFLLLRVKLFSLVLQ
tara:strand:+ start:698 stop:1063 length:366 start_codon:yes stop_codon:yes gene_type:complete